MNKIDLNCDQLKIKIMLEKIVITSAKRTAVGSLSKTLKNIPANELGASVISDIIKQSN